MSRTVPPGTGAEAGDPRGPVTGQRRHSAVTAGRSQLRAGALERSALVGGEARSCFPDGLEMGPAGAEGSHGTSAGHKQPRAKQDSVLRFFPSGD